MLVTIGTKRVNSKPKACTQVVSIAVHSLGIICGTVRSRMILDQCKLTNCTIGRAE